MQNGIEVFSNRGATMILYTELERPLDHSVRLVLMEKDVNVAFEYVDGERPQELEEYHPYGGILTLVSRELVLYEPSIIMEYLDERFPHPPLLPVEPICRAENRQLRYRIRTDLYPLFDALKDDNELKATAARKEIRDQLTTIAPLCEHKPFFMSDEFSLLDCCMAPLLWRLRYEGIRLPPSAKAIRAYAERLFSRPAFVNSLSSKEKMYDSYGNC